KTAKIEGLNEFYATQDGFFRLLAALIRQSLKLEEGSDALLDRFDARGIQDIITLNRVNVAKKRFGLF
ncbi:hypothetical protein XcuCFBP2542_01205, partial [Xanthomonas cucurbitae]